jgi:serine/threonine-protein kinase
MILKVSEVLDIFLLTLFLQVCYYITLMITSGNSPTPSSPQAIPGYQIVSKLGAGGMGVVFKANDVEAKRLVALKVLFPRAVKNPDLLNRFIKEAQLLIKFDHENIVKGYRYGHINNVHFFAMEYIEGPSVQDLINKQGSLGEELALNIIVRVAKALDYIEKQGILHRDIKPDNLLLTLQGTVKLCDLGFAQEITQKVVVDQTEFTSGTPQYMSPEQARGQLHLDIRSDIYSLGATLYHMVTGKVPFAGTDNLEVMAQQVLKELKSEEIKNRGFSPLTLYFIEKMMAKEKEIRYQNPAAVIEDIQSQIAGFKSLEYQPEE